MKRRDSIKTTITVPGDLHWEFQSEVVRRRTSIKAAIEEALRAWVDSRQRGGNAEDIGETVGNSTAIHGGLVHNNTYSQGEIPGDSMSLSEQLSDEESQYLSALVGLLRGDPETADAVKRTIHQFSTLHELVNSLSEPGNAEVLLEKARRLVNIRRRNADTGKNDGKTG